MNVRNMPLEMGVGYSQEEIKKMHRSEEATESEEVFPTPKRPRSKKKETRDKILKAALQVFSRHPYQSSSIRMISKLGEIDHALISYHFGSKAELFKAVLSRKMEERLELQKGWFAAVKPMGAARGFSLFLDFILDDYRKRPGLFHIVSLNFQQADLENPIPGYDLVEAFIKTDVGRMKESLDLDVPDHEAEMFIRAMSTLLIGFLGSAGSYAKMMDMDPDSIIYFNWVKETVLFTLLPRFKQMVQNLEPNKEVL